jgi:LPXTG-site transpeptidase (sortase) family protein
MSDIPAPSAYEAHGLSRRDALTLGGAFAVGLAFAGRAGASVLDDPVRGVPAPALPGAGTWSAPLPGRANVPARRGRKGFRPRPPYPLGKAIGSITIPRLGVNETLYEGVDLWVLDGGPGHWPGTVMPGQAGNCVVAGHRVSHGRTFRYLDLLGPGDELRLGALGLDHTYVFTSSFVVDPTELWILDNSAARTATLFACHPPGSVALRIVATFAMV